jgi:prepilin-type processing-associated H-X9-DG protein
MPNFTGTDETNQSFGARSRHKGGVNVSYCDGSVDFIGNEIDLPVWRAKTTAAGSDFAAGMIP